MKELFNDGWQFSKIHLESADQKIDLNDIQSSLKSISFSPVEIPHDWLIYNTKDLYENSVGIYKKDFALPEEKLKQGSRFFLRFEGIYMDSSIFLNGRKIFEWKYGYTTFETDITPFAKAGTNTIVVCAVYRSPNSRWYSGAGIYRNVWLITTPKAHIVQDGVSWKAEKTQDNAYKLNILSETIFHSNGKTDSSKLFEGRIIHKLYEAEKSGDFLVCGKQLAETEKNVSMNALFTDDKPYFFVENQEMFTRTIQSLELKNIKEWSTEEPNLYLLKTELLSKDGKIIHSSLIRTGFCTQFFDKDKGFFLNGKHLKVHGACMHHDLGALGAAFNKSAARRQLEKLKKMGINAIRTSHNPYAPAFLDLADELGFLIDSEGFDMWEKNKTAYDYANYFNDWVSRDTASWIRRDRSHVSVFMWSIGNEIYDTHKGNGLEIAKKLVKLVHKNDILNKAPTTIASNYIAWEGAQRCMQEVDIAGYNYTERLYDEHHKTYPDWKIYGSETSSTVQSRGIYHFPASFRSLTHDDGQCSSLGNCSTNWGAKDSAAAITADRNASFCFGQFIWTGFDYIGEPTPYFTKNSYFGQIDTAGFEKDSFYAYQAEWTSKDKSPMVHILPYWDFNDNQLIDIRVFSNCAKSELFFNGKSLGSFVHNHINGNEISGKWQIPYQKGTLHAKGYDENGRCIAEDTQASFSDSFKIEMQIDNIEDINRYRQFKKNRDLSENTNLFPDFTDVNDNCLMFVSISTKDRDGQFVPNARNRIKVRVEGGTILGLDNGDSTDYDQYKSDERSLFSGRLTAIIQADDILNRPPVIEAVSPGLAGAKLTYNGKSAIITQIPAVQTDGFIPVRKIELSADGSLDLTPANKSVRLKAELFPKTAAGQKLLWQAVRLEGIESKCVEIEKTDNTHVIVHAKSDGEFLLRCSCNNNAKLMQVISEYAMTVSGIGSSSLSAYNFISGCEATLSLNKKVLSFQGGSFLAEGRNWIGFENVDFGKDGSDELTIPVFAFNDKLIINLWDGIPDTQNGKILEKLTYQAKSIYNHYQPNTWKLSRRLFGVHTICFETYDTLSLKGFVFAKSSKAFAKLSSLDAANITGDSFKKTEDAVLNIGNNVVIEYRDMDFGTEGASHLKLCGRAPSGANTIQLKFSPVDNPEAEETVTVLEVAESKDYRTFDFDFDQIKGLQKVSFVFLPGCNFDFKNFTFS
ncbi:MAG: DUF4982 domain-containing protein [Spirochaetaceae bacterium]|nr:DUF4982 domain-containing protein [Spirochaetaceae bacterium]